MPIKLTTPLEAEVLNELKAGDEVLISGEIYTARDAAHKRMFEALERGESLPFPIEGAVLYYVGPTPAPPGFPIGSAGPTTSLRMDAFTPRLYELGLKATIGKGKRSAEVVEACKRFGAVYLAATGGVGALLAQRIREAEIIAYPDLGPEAIRRLVVEDFPAVVVIDTNGNDLYELGRAQFERKVA